MWGVSEHALAATGATWHHSMPSVSQAAELASPDPDEEASGKASCPPQLAWNWRLSSVRDAM